MATIKCPKCANEASTADPVCRHCGHVLNADQLRSIKNAERDFTIKAITFGVLLLGIGWLVYSCSLSSGKSRTVRQSIPAEVVSNSAWDGSVHQVVRWLEKNLRDPSSVEYIEWSPVTKVDSGGYRVRVKYRAKNGFGGYVVSNQLFALDADGQVVSHTDYISPP